MEKIREIQLPTWARAIFANDDHSGVSEQDSVEAASWYAEQVEEHGPITLEHTGEFEEFTAHPEFGLACETERVIIWAD